MPEPSQASAQPPAVGKREFAKAECNRSRGFRRFLGPPGPSDAPDAATSLSFVLCTASNSTSRSESGGVDKDDTLQNKSPGENGH